MGVDFSALKEVLGWLEEGPPLPPSDVECRAVGDAFLDSKRCPALRVPSIIVPFSSNFLLNPAHPLIDRVKIGSVDSFVFDRRLL